jgi:hypothetical protein
MAISRMQQPRQMYGLGSLVKKAVKGVKSFVKSDLGKAALLGIGAFGLPTAGDTKYFWWIFISYWSFRCLKTGVGTNVLFGKERGVFPGERTGGHI